MVGAIIFGKGLGMYASPLLPEITEIMQKELDSQGVKYDKDDLFNTTSGYFIMFMAVGQAIGPFSSSQINNEYKFGVTMWILIAFSTAYLLTYAAVCGRK